MKFYESGLEEGPVILLFPGTCCHWKTNFESVRGLLEKAFHVVSVSYDGFDETEDTVFPDMITECEKTEEYVRQKFGGSVRCAYGCSLGGSFVSLLIQRKNIHIEHGIIGSSDMDQAGKFKAAVQGRIVSGIFAKIIQKGVLPGWAEKRMAGRSAEEQAYMRALLEKMFNLGKGGMPFVKKKSIYNQFVSDLVTPVDEQIDVPGTKIHVFYAGKMGDTYLKRYMRYFANPDIRRNELEHEELLVKYPDSWIEEVKSCCDID